MRPTRVQLREVWQHPATQAITQTAVILASILLRNHRHPVARAVSGLLTILSGVLAAPTLLEGARAELKGLERIVRQLRKEYPEHRDLFQYVSKTLKSLNSMSLSQ